MTKRTPTTAMALGFALALALALPNGALADEATDLDADTREGAALVEEAPTQTSDVSPEEQLDEAPSTDEPSGPAEPAEPKTDQVAGDNQEESAAAVAQDDSSASDTTEANDDYLPAQPAEEPTPATDEDTAGEDAANDPDAKQPEAESLSAVPADANLVAEPEEEEEVPQGTWEIENGKTYYRNASGNRVRYSQTIDGKPYYFNGTTYEMKTGWLTWSDGTRSYFGEDGAAVTGWQTIGGKTYYFNSNWRAVRYSQTLTGTDGKKHLYYFDGNTGAMQTGWLTWKADGTRSFFAQNSKYIPEGAAFTGWVSVSGSSYYFNPSTYHSLRYSQTLTGRDGKQHFYYFDGTTSAMHTGWLTWKADGTRSFFAQNSKYIPEGAAFTGWISVDGSSYYIKPSNYKTVHYRQTLRGKDGKTHDYYFNGKTGAMQTGIVKFDDGAALYGSDGAKVTSGWVTIGKDKYYVRSGSPVRYRQTISGNRYYFDGSTYKMFRGLLYFASEGTWTYYDDTTGIGTNPKSGWYTSGGKYYFFDASGKPVYDENGNKITWTKSSYETWFRIKDMTSKTKYLGAVDQDRTYTTFYIRQDGMWVPLISWVCSVGSNASPTPKGSYEVWYRSTYQLHHIQNGEGRGVWYWTNWGPNGEAFHSVLTQPDSKKVTWAGLGLHNSGGCVRCPMEMAKWTYDHIRYGTRVYSY